MNKNRTIVGVVSLSLMIFSVGCKTFSTPSGVLEISMEALQENNLERFRSTLTGTALAEFGNELGMSRMRQKLSAFVKLDTANLQKISTVKTGPNQWLTTSTIDVIGASLESEAPHVWVGAATTLCVSKQVLVHRPKHRVEVKKKTECRISEFN